MTQAELMQGLEQVRRHYRVTGGAATHPYRKAFKGTNFITNEGRFFVRLGRGLVEVSWGLFRGDYLYGVTVADNPRETNLDLSEAVFSPEELMGCLEELSRVL